jgi:L,D-peptidoglycan transpeptidase YkuD (ErfK/YbiS/YcfS/YnhG family)
MRAIVTSSNAVTLGGRTFRCASGRGGIRADKREGDGGTPTGILPLRQVLYRPDRLPSPACAVPVRALTPDDGWCDDPAHPDYNRPVRMPFAASAESLWRGDSVYDLIGVLGWNDSPIVPGLGSAIFLHIARPDFSPTEGCIALTREDMSAILAMGLTEIEVRD